MIGIKLYMGDKIKAVRLPSIDNFEIAHGDKWWEVINVDDTARFYTLKSGKRTITTTQSQFDRIEENPQFKDVTGHFKIKRKPPETDGF